MKFFLNSPLIKWLATSEGGTVLCRIIVKNGEEIRNLEARIATYSAVANLARHGIRRKNLADSQSALAT